VTTLGGTPHFDPASLTRRQALGQAGEEE